MKATKLFSLLSLLAVLVLVLGACAQPAAPTQAPVETAAPPTEAAPTEVPATEAPAAEPAATEPPAAAPVEIVYMRQAEGSEAELKLVEEFNSAHPDILVKVDSVPAEDNYSKLVLTTEAGNPPDVYMSYFTLGAATNGLALDISPYIEKEGDEWFKSLSENGWVFHEYAGKYYGVPWRVAPSMVILNTDLLAKNNLSLPKNDWTWEDFLSYAKTMTHPDTGEYGFCIMGSAEDPGTDYQFYPFLFEAGGKMINDKGLSAFNSPEGAEALQFMVDMINTDKVTPPGTTSATANACIDLLAAGKVGMWTNANLWVGIIRGTYPDVKITVVPMPTHTTTGALNGGTGFSISPKSKNPDAAWEFIKFMVSEESMRAWTSAFYFTPPNVSILNDPEFLKDPEQAATAYAMLNQKMYPLAHYPDSSNLESILRSYIQAAYLQQSTPADALAGAAAEWDAALEGYLSDNWWAAGLR
jgi:ABC-type glycerol-3-phosphate transport system substrate-binding protein